MSVRAKFYVSEVGDRAYSSAGKIVHSGRVIKLSPVYAGDDPNHENRKFWDATPSGSIEMTIKNSDAAAQFEVGREYYVDFTPA